MLFGEIVCVVEVIRGVQFVIAQKIESASVKGIGARARDRVDYPARSEAVLRGIVAGQYGEFLNRIHAQILTQYAPRARIGIVIYERTVQTITILSGPASVDGHFYSQAAGSLRAGGMRLDL